MPHVKDTRAKHVARGQTMVHADHRYYIRTATLRYTLLHLVPNITYCSDSHSAANTLSVSPSAIGCSFTMQGRIREVLMSIPVICRSDRWACSRKKTYSDDSITDPITRPVILP